MKIKVFQLEMPISGKTKRDSFVFSDEAGSEETIQDFLLCVAPFVTGKLFQAIALDKADNISQRKLEITIDY